MNHIPNPLMDIQHLNDFVSPGICKYLYDRGIRPRNTTYKWRVVNGNAELITYAFDTDGYYAAAFSNVDFVYPPHYLPAFTITDMSSIMPDYTIRRSQGLFTIEVDTPFVVEPCQDRRLPDAMAKMVADLIHSSIISPVDAAIKISLKA